MNRDNLSYENRNHVERFHEKNFEEYLGTVHGSNYHKYREQWNEAESGGLILDHPLHVELGLTSYCNLRCKMCFRSEDNPKLEKHNMSIDIAQKIADQCKELGVAAIALGEGSEGLLHPQIKDIIEIFSKSNCLDYFVMTNGLLLNEDISQALLDNNVDRLNISIDAATKETYKKIRGANLEILEKNIERFLEIRGNRKLPLLRVSFVKQENNFDEIQAFLDKWKDKADIVDFQDMVNYGNVDNLLQIDEDIDYICPLPFTKMCIRWNGDMYPCTNPYQKYFKLGNISETSIEEAWNSDLMKELRKSMLDKKMPLACKNCRGTRYFSNIFNK